MVDKMKMSVDLDPGGRFSAYMQKVKKSVTDLSFSMGEAARIIKKESGANFILKGSGKYVPLSPVYQARKQALAPGVSILVGVNPGGGVSGKLRDSIVQSTPDSVLRVGKLSLDVGTSVTSKDGAPYPRFIQGGTRNMPGRPFLFLTDKMVDRILNTIEGEIAKDWKKPFRF